MAFTFKAGQIFDEKSRQHFEKSFSEKLSAFFVVLLFVGERQAANREKNFPEALEGLEKRVSRKFESYMMGKTGVWHLRKNPVLF